MKKIIALLLTLTMIFALSVPALQQTKRSSSTSPASGSAPTPRQLTSANW